MALFGAETWTLRKVDQMPLKILKWSWKEVGEDQLDRQCENWNSTWSQRAKEYLTYCEKKKG